MTKTEYKEKLINDILEIQLDESYATRKELEVKPILLLESILDYRKDVQARENEIKRVKENIIEKNRNKRLRDIPVDNCKTWLQRYRILSELSQSQLAELSGVNLRMIQNYEQGFKDINKAQALTLYKLSKVLDVNIDDLLEK